MLRMVSGGAFVDESVNLGGIYHAAGRQEVLPYLFLSDDDRSRIQLLLDERIEVRAQDLPSSHAVDGRHLLDT
jgi:mannose/fructose/N-acetylgalactosamine-specific phosphotransferase system component IIB